MRVNEQGRSMIEMLGVLAIVGVLSVGGIAGYSKAMNKFKTNKAVDQINMIATNIRTLYSSQKTYAGLNNQVAVKTGVIPGEMYDANSASTSTITNAFGGSTYLTTTKHQISDDAFVVAIDKIPQAACVSIATTEWGGDSGSGLLAMAISTDANAAAAKLTSDTRAGAKDLAVIGDQNYGLPFSVVNASLSCTGENNSIAWMYL